MKTRFLLLLSIFTVAFTFSQTKEQISHLDAYYQKSLDEWHIPGMAIAIVKDGKIVFSKGYGFADLNKKTKVNGNTLFAIASNSKAFTASSIAQLVDQGKLKWTDKVVDYLPYYKLYDDYTTQNTTIEDLLCHRNGLKTFSGDLLWYGTTLSQEYIINAQQHLKPIFPFRTQFGYSNIAFIAAGKIIEKVTDTTWTDYVSTHFLKPLKMDRTLTSTNQIANSTNVATPYFYENGKHFSLEWVNWDNMAPAGALISSVNDYAKWLILNANEGVFNETTFLSKKSFQNMTTPHTNFKVRKNDQKHHFKSYGLGWGLQDYQGYKIVGHGGGYDGMISKSTFVPEKKLGIIVLTNSLNWLPTAIVNKSLDVILADDLKGKDWSKDFLTIKENQDKAANVKLSKNEKLRYKIQKSHFDFSDYTGIYTDKMYGTVTIKLDKNQLHFSMDNTPIYQANLQHWNGHIFTFRFDTSLSSLPEGKLWFDVDKNSKIKTLHIDVPNYDFFFDEFTFRKN
jgi:CubicO group peptidase (beta-lactamase class C family)